MELEIQIGGETAIVTVGGHSDGHGPGGWSAQLQQHGGKGYRLDREPTHLTVSSSPHDSAESGVQTAELRAVYHAT